MKKFLAFTMAAAMTLSLAACGGGSSSGSNTSADGSGSAAFKLGGTGPPDRRRLHLRPGCPARRSDRCG